MFTANTWSSFLSYSLKYFIASLHQSASSILSSSGAFTFFFYFFIYICHWANLHFFPFVQQVACEEPFMTAQCCRNHWGLRCRQEDGRERLRQVKVRLTQHRRKQQREQRGRGGGGCKGVTAAKDVTSSGLPMRLKKGQKSADNQVSALVNPNPIGGE